MRVLSGMEEVYQRKFRPLAATYVTYSPDGTELLVNLGKCRLQKHVPKILIELGPVPKVKVGYV